MVEKMAASEGIGRRRAMVSTSDTSMEASAAGRALAAKRKVVVRQCAVCGKEIVGIGRKAYCGNTCIVKAYRRRKYERRQTQQSPGG
jgi:predicted RNA-binding Zn-ribbon protein involved in translation (DUF1610 family)